jgi:beta-xylosidase
MVRSFSVILGASLLSMAAMAQNPFVQTWYTSDPAPMVQGDRIYVYTGHDEDRADFFWMQEWRVYSSADMVNWTDHGSPLALESFRWADDRAWASQCIERNGKFYWYICAHSRLSGGMAIGVAVADSPAGPYRDAIGKPLYENGSWDHIDPTVFIDDDGQAYMYWGNPYVYYVKLNEDMISTSGDIHVLNPQNGVMRPVKENGAKMNLRAPWSQKANWAVQHYQEGPWFYKRSGHYYLGFASTCCPEALGYAMSDSPTGPWVEKGYIMRPTERDRGNHPGICDFKGHSYVFGQDYDLMHLETFHHHERRSVSAQEISYNADGTIQEIPYWLDQQPMKQLQWLNPYRRVEAETMAWGFGLKSAKMGIENTGVVKDMPESVGKKNMYIFDVNDGEYIRLRGVDFGSKGARQFSIMAAAAAQAGCTVTLRLDAQDGPVIGTATVKSTGSVDKYKSFSTKVTGATGVHDLYLCFSKAQGDVRLDYWQFK